VHLFAAKNFLLSLKQLFSHYKLVEDQHLQDKSASDGCYPMREVDEEELNRLRGGNDLRASSIEYKAFLHYRN
jgi:hypothetical protein